MEVFAPARVLLVIMLILMNVILDFFNFFYLTKITFLISFHLSTMFIIYIIYSIKVAFGIPNVTTIH